MELWRDIKTPLERHWLNTGNGSIIPQVEGLNDQCPIRFALEFIDSELNPIVAVQKVIERLYGVNTTCSTQDQRCQMGNNELPQQSATFHELSFSPCAFLGAIYSGVTEHTSIVTAGKGLTQVSGQSIATTLDNRAEYPKFARVIPSVGGGSSGID